MAAVGADEAVAVAAVAEGGVEMNRVIMMKSLLALLLMSAAASAEPQKFESPEAAVGALVSALEAKDKSEILAIFGPENEDVVSGGDPEEDREIWGRFLQDVQAVRRIDREGEDRAILLAGRELWPFPAPLVAAEGRWHFDAEAAREEVLMRRIGRNELAVIDIMRRVGGVQTAYRQVDHDGDGVREFAASILSGPDARDGLYWPDEEGTEPSPFGEEIARASLTGFRRESQDIDPEPFEGYYFRILQGQGANAPGGAYNYMVAGHMVAGHAVLAVPAIYGDTGVMSFMVSEGGAVYEADLGEATLETAIGIELFDPGEGWEVVK
jgi:hypothetical protein